MAVRRLYEPLCIAFGTTVSSPTAPTYQLYEGREVQQRLDFVRWEGRQESKWEAAAAAVVVAAAATAAGVQARWWVRKGRARQRQRRATAAAAATASAAAAAAATAERCGWAEAAPACLSRRAERVLHSQLRHGGRGLRLGGGGKRGWVT